MSDVNAVVTVHYIKHWDNNLKGYIEFGEGVTIARAVALAEAQLLEEAIEDGVDGDLATVLVYTITKAEFTVPTNWLGVPAGI